MAGCASGPDGPDPNVPPVVGEYGPAPDSLYADLLGTSLRIASDRDGVCIPPVSHVTDWQEGDDTLMVWLEDDVVPGCSGEPAVACFDVEADFTSRQYVDVELMLPLTGAPPLPLGRGKKIRAHGPQCP